jgi:hypothetical protein
MDSFLVHTLSRAGIGRHLMTPKNKGWERLANNEPKVSVQELAGRQEEGD